MNLQVKYENFLPAEQLLVFEEWQCAMTLSGMQESSCCNLRSIFIYVGSVSMFRYWKGSAV